MLRCFRLFLFAAVGSAVSPWAKAADTAGKSIPFDQLGTEAQKQYQGDGIAITPTPGGARLRAAFQKLEAEATPKGLWLKSTEASTHSDRFRVLAATISREGHADSKLAATGQVIFRETEVSFVRPGLVEEYRVSMDGVRQDFVVLERPVGTGDLRVGLEVTGAAVTTASSGVKFTLAGSGREIAYGRLQVTDATGRKLAARMEVAGTRLIQICAADAGATYPIRVDPTFSDANWASMGGVAGPNGSVTAIAIGPDGKLYIGGGFTVIGQVMASHVAVWEGTSWSALDSGVSGAVWALKMSGADLYVGGEFSTAGGKSVNCIAKWDGAAWNGLGTGMDDEVYALEVMDGAVYAGGYFSEAGGVTVNHIAKWDGFTWSALGQGTDGDISVLKASNSQLFVGGHFVKAGGITVNHVAKWSAAQWSALGTGVTSGGSPDYSFVRSIAMNGTDLYVAGSFYKAGGVDANNIAKWNGNAWSAVGSGMNGIVWSLAASEGNVYASSGNEIARWDGTAWSTVSSGLNGYVYAMVIRDDGIYAGGTFTQTAGVNCRGIAKWDGSAWSGLGENGPLGLDGEVDAIAVSDTDVYVAGNFITAGGISVNRIAKWDGSSWSGFGSGMSGGPVRALAVSGTTVYAGGDFTLAGGGLAPKIARWDGSKWNFLGSSPSPNGSVRALAISGTNLYVGGYFTTVGAPFPILEVTVNNIAKWDGTTWSPLGSGMDYGVNCLSISGSELYAGGSFDTAGGVSAKGIAKWDGATWSAVGSGFDGSVSALLLSGNDLYAGGSFTLGGISRKNVGKWDGSTWSSVGPNIDGYVRALAMSGATLYVAGDGYFSPPFVQRWTGSQWVNLGSGMNGNVNALAVLSSNLYAGGAFTVAGGKVSTYFTRGDLQSPAVGVSGNGMEITPGDTAPSVNDDTDFSGTTVNGGSVTHTFTIINAGDKELELTGTPKVAIGGVDAVHFSVTSQPNSPIAAGESSTFAVKFNPSSAGTKSATVTVASSDEDKNPYTFTIQGTGLTPGLVAFTAAKFAVNQGAVQVRLTVERTGGAVPFEVAINTADGTANKTPPFAAATTPSDYVDLAGPKAILSFGEGEMSQDVFVTLAPKSGTQPNKRFIATISAPTNGASLGDITETTIEILANDTTKPTLTVAAPTNGAKISTLSPYLVTGIAGDAKGIDRVEVALNGADALPATLGPATIPTSVPYSLPISPSPGSNTLVVTAYDLRGNSASVTRSFTFMRRYLLTITRGDSAAGTVALVATPSTAASALTPTAASSNPKTSQILPGTTVKLTATPKTGFVFKDWLGLPEDAAVLGNLVTFAMPAADATITAEFIATPFTPPAGQTNTFLGLIHPTGGTPSSNATEGFLTGTLTTAGAFTGKLLIDGVSQPIAAVFFGDGSALFTVGATKQTSLNFGGRILTSSFNTGAITADLTKDTNTSAGTATRPIYSTANKVTTELLNSAAKGFYTLSFPPMEQTPPVDIATYPQGHGFATLNLSNAGAITLTGMLADGVAVTASSALLNGDTAPIFARLSTPGATAIKGGSFSGTVAFDNTQTDSDVTATDLLWFRPAAVGATTPLYTPGWPNGIRVNAFGALYATATKVQATLGLDVTGNAQLFFSAGKLNPGIIKANFKIVANTVIKPSPIDTSFTLTLAPTTGAFSGTFTPNWPTPATAKPAFKGILIQKGANKGGFGYFLSNAKSDPDPESGSVTLSAP